MERLHFVTGGSDRLAGKRLRDDATLVAPLQSYFGIRLK